MDACKLSCSVYMNEGRDEHSYVRFDMGDTVVFAFRGSLEPHVLTSTTTKFGECQIHDIGCLEWMKDANNQPALVHESSLTQFLPIWNNSRLQEEVSLAYGKGKTVVFTGHYMGGAIASLATLCILDKQLQPGNPKSIFCITFGFPLVGDEVVARAVRRKSWADQFCHVVLGCDVFSRILLAPCMSVRQSMEAMLPYLERSMKSAGDFIGSSDTPMEEALPEGIAEFVRTVLQHCSAVVNYSSAAKMCPNNPLIASIKPLVKLSPYRPFGHYVFLSRTGGIWMKNHFAVLPILYYALQNNSEHFMLEHVLYNHVLPNALQNTVKLELSDLPLSNAGSRMATEMEALGLGIQNCQARLALNAAEQFLKQQRENVSKVENEYPAKMEKAMKALEDYRSSCLRNGTGYLDAFKNKQRRDLDFHANLRRLELAGWWDEIILNMFDKDELPDDFQCSEEWLRRGTHYRLLVEPLDIANYYRLGKNEDSGFYGRPRRYKTLEKWLEDNEETKQLQPPTMLTQDSCLWAYVEEIACLKQKNNYNDEKRTELENRVRPLIESNGLCMGDLMTGESTFKKVVNWLWKHMTPVQREISPFRSIMPADSSEELIE